VLGIAVSETADRDENERLASFAARHPDIFTPFASVSPLERDAVEHLMWAARDLRCRGLNIAPVHCWLGLETT
jgi:predicted TIM-barrel fold metal-dependent hydrolase